MTSASPSSAAPVETDPLKLARQRWQNALAAVNRHTLRSDPQLDLDLLNYAKELPSWRGPLALIASFVLPKVPAYMGDQTGFAAAFFVMLGGLALGFAVWLLIKDGTKWWRWAAARRALDKGNYRFSHLAPMAGLPATANLCPVLRESEEWETLGQWAQRDAQLLAIWKRWNGGNPPIRQWDMRVLEEAVFALTKLQDLKKSKPSQSASVLPEAAASQG